MGEQGWGLCPRLGSLPKKILFDFESILKDFSPLGDSQEKKCADRRTKI